MATRDFSELASDTPADDLARNVHCILGLPIDALDMPTILRRIEAAAASRTPFLISTPNLNWLVNSRSDPEFRESVLDGDLCPADGMPIVWIARLIGAPIRQRVSGSDIFEALNLPDRCARRLNVFLFGGEEGVALAAGKALNAAPTALNCVGTFDPGFGTVADMSRHDILDKVNASEADFLAVSLGAWKGQLWLHRNHNRLTIPVRAHLGAVINFAAGTVKRAPVWIRACGLEWLWRIKEEPHLWRRYAHDGLIFLHLVFANALPLAVLNRWYALKSKHKPKDLIISNHEYPDFVTMKLSGDANERNIGKAIACFRDACKTTNRAVMIDLKSVRVVDARFLGLLLMLRKCLRAQGRKLEFVGVSPAIRNLFRLNMVDFLLERMRKPDA